MPGLPSYFSSENVGTLFEPSFVRLGGNLKEKMKTMQYFMMKEVLWELAMDSQSDMVPEDNDFLPDGDDFVVSNSDEAVLDEPVFFLFCFAKTDWKVFAC